ncbi:hypothetical protein E2C01_036408 [Portunus trituberculatus]|uniref:Uncharacterized protein n=1 Tax=Portunus trituberculatus TaxID=210409 RepID=A0A5B7FB36_PORTR|nr:hypothetical protein [Portunus trituberculatus]
MHFPDSSANYPIRPASQTSTFPSHSTARHRRRLLLFPSRLHLHHSTSCSPDLPTLCIFSTLLLTTPLSRPLNSHSPQPPRFVFQIHFNTPPAPPAPSSFGLIHTFSFLSPLFTVS